MSKLLSKLQHCKLPSLVFASHHYLMYLCFGKYNVVILRVFSPDTKLSFVRGCNAESMAKLLSELKH